MTDPAVSQAFSIRPLGQDDEAALLEFWNRSATMDPMSQDLLAQKVWQDPDFDADGAWIAEGAGVMLGFVLAVTRPSGNARLGVIKLLAVDPASRRRGLGSRLLSRAEHHLQSKGVIKVCVCESPPNYLSPGVDLRYLEGLRFLHHHGYRETSQACNMAISLVGATFGEDDTERRLRADGWTIRRASDSDRQVLSDFLDTFGGTWREEVFASLRFSTPLVHLAFRQGQLLGFAASEGNNTGTGWFGPMGTAPPARGLGIGRALLFRCLTDLQALGFGEAVIPWVGPVGFYEKHAGARVSRRFQRFEKDLHA